MSNVVAIRGYLTFILGEKREHRKTDIYHVLNSSNGTYLGHISWKSQWRKYCFFPHAETVFDSTCLETITVFIRNLMDKRRHKK